MSFREDIINLIPEMKARHQEAERAEMQKRTDEAAQQEEAERNERRAPARMKEIGRETIDVLMELHVPTVPIWQPSESEDAGAEWYQDGEGWHLMSNHHWTHNELVPEETTYYALSTDNRFGTFWAPGLNTSDLEMHGIVRPNFETTAVLLRIMESDVYKPAVAHLIATSTPYIDRD